MCDTFSNLASLYRVVPPSPSSSSHHKRFPIGSTSRPIAFAERIVLSPPITIRANSSHFSSFSMIHTFVACGTRFVVNGDIFVKLTKIVHLIGSGMKGCGGGAKWGEGVVWERVRNCFGGRRTKHAVCRIGERDRGTENGWAHHRGYRPPLLHPPSSSSSTNSFTLPRPNVLVHACRLAV